MVSAAISVIERDFLSFSVQRAFCEAFGISVCITVIMLFC